MIALTPFRGVVWRILFAGQAGATTAPAHHPEGRFHHDGQVALYASLSAGGAGVALRRYLRADDPPRIIVPLEVTLIRACDLRGTEDQAAASVVWQDDRAETGMPSPTWTCSDRARGAGAQGMLYASRSRPDLSHIVLFEVSPATVRQVGAAQDWVPPRARSCPDHRVG